MFLKTRIFARHFALIFLGRTQKKNIAPFAPYVKSFRVGLFDLDMNLHMTNSRYNFFIDTVIVNFMMDSGLWDYLFTHKSNPHVMTNFIRFRRGFGWKDKFDLSLQIIGVTDKWIFYEFKFIKDGFVHCQALRKLAYHKRGDGFLNPIDLLAKAGHENMKLDPPEYVEKWLEAEDIWMNSDMA